jgi:hypothetical protein
LQNILKGAAISLSRYYPGICLRELSKTMKDFDQGSQRPGHVVTAKLTHSVFLGGIEEISLLFHHDLKNV